MKPKEGIEVAHILHEQLIGIQVIIFSLNTCNNVDIILDIIAVRESNLLGRELTFK